VGRRLLRALAVVALIGVVGGAIGPVRRAALRGAGLMLVAGDDAGPADVLVMDVESGGAGVLAISDLHRSQPRATVGILVPAGTGVDRELHRRGIVLPNLTLEMFAQLGIPKEAIIRIPAGEGGTTETTAAIGEWGRRNPGKRVLVVVGPSHGRRFRRALRRVWPDDRQPAPIVVTTPYSMFRADSWWQSRTTLREGLVELEKLALDYARHPWN
jgi:hypothetical protein